MKKAITKQVVVKTATLILGGLAVLGIICVIMWFKLREITTSQVESHVSGYGAMAAQIIDNHLNDEIASLEMMTSVIDKKTGIPDYDFENKYATIGMETTPYSSISKLETFSTSSLTALLYATTPPLK